MSELIKTQGLTKRFGGLVAVDSVDFCVNEGDAAGVIGPNGSGKTTLFNLLSGYFAPTEGSIVFQGQDVTKLPPQDRVAMGMVRTFQLVSVFNSLAVWENLVLASIRFQRQQTSLGKFYFFQANRREIADKCFEALKTVGLEKRAFTRTSELSYGDKRKLEIAIALTLRPRLLLLDEPLAGLSDYEIAEVLGLVRQLKENFTLVIIEHKISKIVDLVGRLSVMNEGRIIAEGLPQEVLCDPAVRECYWGKEENTCST